MGYDLFNDRVLNLRENVDWNMERIQWNNLTRDYISSVNTDIKWEKVNSVDVTAQQVLEKIKTSLNDWILCSNDNTHFFSEYFDIEWKKICNTLKVPPQCIIIVAALPPPSLTRQQMDMSDFKDADSYNIITHAKCCLEMCGFYLCSQFEFQLCSKCNITILPTTLYSIQIEHSSIQNQMMNQSFKPNATITECNCDKC